MLRKPRVQFTGVAWFEKRLSEAAVARQAIELCSTPDKRDPDLNDLTHVCQTFFGEDYTSFATADAISIRLHNIPGAYGAHRAYLVPFHKAAIHWNKDRPAGLLLIHPEDEQKSFQSHLHSKYGAMLKLYKLYVTDTQCKLVDEIEQRIIANCTAPPYISPPYSP